MLSKEVDTELRPTDFIKQTESDVNSTNGTSSKATALIILNSPISQFEYFRRLYQHATSRICADGGANRLCELLTHEYPDLNWQDALSHALPDIIHGDLDSLDDAVRKKYEQLGVEVSQDPDQYSTDFGKAIKKTIERAPDAKEVLILGSIGGRVDQGIGLLHELYREQKFRHPDIRFWLFSEASISTILKPGSIAIYTPLESGLIKRNIGILPLYGPATISTQGLEWDVEDWPTAMGGQVSTSNHIMTDRIVINTDNEVLFTVERAVGW